MPEQSFQEAYVEQLRDIYSAESQLVEALPKIAEAVDTTELKEAVKKHLKETKGHIERLEKVFEMLEEKPEGKTCKAMKGLIAEGEEALKEMEAGPVRDAAIIVAAQKVEHYEIAAYGSVVTWAEQLGMTDHAQILEDTLEEEKATDDILTQIAESVVNLDAEEETAATSR